MLKKSGNLLFKWPQIMRIHIEDIKKREYY